MSFLVCLIFLICSLLGESEMSPVFPPSFTAKSVTQKIIIRDQISQNLNSSNKKQPSATLNNFGDVQSSDLPDSLRNLQEVISVRREDGTSKPITNSRELMFSPDFETRLTNASEISESRIHSDFNSTSPFHGALLQIQLPKSSSSQSETRKPFNSPIHKVSFVPRKVSFVPNTYFTCLRSSSSQTVKSNLTVLYFNNYKNASIASRSSIAILPSTLIPATIINPAITSSLPEQTPSPSALKLHQQTLSPSPLTHSPRSRKSASSRRLRAVAATAWPDPPPRPEWRSRNRAPQHQQTRAFGIHGVPEREQTRESGSPQRALTLDSQTGPQGYLLDHWNRPMRRSVPIKDVDRLEGPSVEDIEGRMNTQGPAQQPSPPVGNLKVSSFAMTPASLHPDTAITSVSAVAGRPVQLPCKLSVRVVDDSPKLILWYKSGTRTPIVSYDGRSRNSQSGAASRGSQTPSGGNSRASVDPESAKLTIKMASVRDEGVYECRVDFFHSPTHNNLVNLTVTEPVRSLEIQDSTGGYPAIGGILGPYVEGSELVLSCTARQGIPTPTISWWRNGEDLSIPYRSVGEGVVQSDLVVERLSRSWDNTSLSCKAQNNDILPPVSRTVTLMLHLLPQSVRVSAPPSARDGGKVRVTCTTAGSSPAATLTWTFQGQHPTPATRNTQYGLVTSSTLELNVTRQDDGAEVKCEAKNPSVPDKPLHNSTTLRVHYPPVTVASFGKSFTPGLLKEGDDVYFTCQVEANPPVTSIEWFHESTRQQQNVSAGVIVSVDSLVLQAAQRHRAGRYYCVATNSVASTTSDPVTLRIKYKPVCASAPITYFIYDEPINVTCSIASYPPVHNIEWRWNGSGEVTHTATQEHDSSSDFSRGDRVTAHFTVLPSKASEDRRLSCLGENEMGSQSVPCNFSINVAKMPAPLSSCRLANITASSLSLTCDRTAHTPDALYRAEVYLANNSLFANVTSQQPSFNVSRLDPATRYEIKVYVTHGPATSQPVHVSAFTSRTARRDRVPEKEMSVGSMTIIILVSLVSVLFILSVVVLLKVCWCNRRGPRDDARSRPQKGAGPGGRGTREGILGHSRGGCRKGDDSEEETECIVGVTSLECGGGQIQPAGTMGNKQKPERGPDVLLSSIEETYKLLSTPDAPSCYGPPPGGAAQDQHSLDSGQFGREEVETLSDWMQYEGGGEEEAPGGMTVSATLPRKVNRDYLRQLHQPCALSSVTVGAEILSATLDRHRNRRQSYGTEGPSMTAGSGGCGLGGGGGGGMGDDSLVEHPINKTSSQWPQCSQVFSGDWPTSRRQSPCQGAAVHGGDDLGKAQGEEQYSRGEAGQPALGSSPGQGLEKRHSTASRELVCRVDQFFTAEESVV